MLQITTIGLISVGVVYVLLLGEIDLSVGAVSGLSAAVMAVLNVKHGWNAYLAIAAAVAVGAGDRLPPGLALQPLRRALLRRHPGRLTGLGRGAPAGARDRPGSLNITDPKITGLANIFYSDTVGWIFAAVVDRRLRRGARRSATAAASPPGSGTPTRCPLIVRFVARRRDRDRRRRDPQLRPRRAAGGDDPARLRGRHGVRGQADHLRPPRLRRRRQRRGGAPRRHPRQPGPGRGLHDRRHDGGDRRRHGRLAPASRSTRTPAATNSCCWRSPAR